MVKSDEMIEEELRKSSDMLSAIFTLNPDAIVLTRVSDGKIIDCNQKFLNLIDYSREDVMGHTVLELNLYSFDERLDYLNKIQSKKTISDYEMRYKQKDGTYINMLYSAQIITINGEKLILNIGKNITKRKMAEQQIEYHALLLNNVNDAIIGTDPDFRITYWNKGAQHMYGYTEAEALGMETIKITRPNYAPGQRKEIINILKHKKTFKVIISTRHRNGTEVITDVNSTQIIDEAGNTSGYVIVYRDITQLKNAEEHKKLMLENEQQLTEELQVANEELVNQSNELNKTNKALRVSEEKFSKAFHDNSVAMTLTDELGKYIDVNESFLNLTGYNREELIGHTSADLGITDAEKHKIALMDFKEKNSIKDIEFEIQTKSGERHNIIGGTELIEIEGNVRLISFIYDITERKEREMLSDALNTVNTYINSTLDYDEIMQLIVEEGAKAIGAESSIINMRDQDNWIVKFAYNFPNSIIGQIKSDQESPTSVYVANEKKAVAFNDAPNDSRVNKNGMKLHGVASVLVAPIILKDEFKGIIAFYHHQKSVVFSEAQIDFATKLASSLSQAVENAQLFDEIKNSEEKYHSLYSSMNEGVALHELIYNNHQEPVDYIIIDINPAYERIIGLKRNEVVGMKASEIYGTGTPPYMELYAPVAEKGESKEFETYFEPMAKHFHISVISPGKGKFATIFEDITERKTSEENLQKTLKRFYIILSNMKASVLLVTEDSRVEFVNQAFCDYFGLKESPIELVNINHSKMIEKIKYSYQNPEEEIKRIKEIVDDWKLVLAEEVLMWDGKSALRDFIPLFVEGERYGRLWLHFDITKRKKMEEELIRSQDNLRELVDKLEVSNRELEQFAYVASHDLQEPLRMVASFTQLLEKRYKGKLDEDADEYIGFIVEGAHRMKDLIDDLLVFSRFNTQANEFELFDMDTALNSVLSYLKPYMNENHAQITHDPLPSIMGDSSQIQQVLQNLLTNAIKFHGDEPPKIHISAEESGDEWTFGVSDNGIGIDSEHQEQIFEVFKRLHTREEYEGTGIGLSICKKIVERHGGRIWVESKPGKGSTFYFTIPLAL
jgi:PAS domain S-box-containing protein